MSSWGPFINDVTQREGIVQNVTTALIGCVIGTVAREGGPAPCKGPFVNDVGVRTERGF